MPDFPNNDEAYWNELKKTPDFQERKVHALAYIIGEKLFGEMEYWKLELERVPDPDQNEDIQPLLLYLKTKPNFQEENLPKTEINQLLREQFEKYSELCEQAENEEDFVKLLRAKFGVEVTEEDFKKADKSVLEDYYYNS